MHRLGGVSAFLTTAFAVAGCSSVSPQESAVAAAATAFRAAVQQSQGAVACALLSPDTAQGVAQAAGKPCPQAILGTHVGGSGSPLRVDAYGQSARVVFADDTVFLADFPGGWRLTGAGCSWQGAKPYTCLVKGA